MLAALCCVTAFLVTVQLSATMTMLAAAPTVIPATRSTYGVGHFMIVRVLTTTICLGGHGLRITTMDGSPIPYVVSVSYNNELSIL